VIDKPPLVGAYCNCKDCSSARRALVTVARVDVCDLEHCEQPERERREETNQRGNRVDILRLPLVTSGIS
jgi:hypothetical protein